MLIIIHIQKTSHSNLHANQYGMKVQPLNSMTNIFTQSLLTVCTCWKWTKIFHDGNGSIANTQYESLAATKKGFKSYYTMTPKSVQNRNYISITLDIRLLELFLFLNLFGLSFMNSYMAYFYCTTGILMTKGKSWQTNSKRSAYQQLTT